ncbi:MAG: hypothetical protein ACTHJR_06860 [Sphingomonas sp.]|uniref:hypothetical protein n=1 Tax=Sphingomonas sp. TaxID=28214 RepID=UPI003F809A61
MRYRYGVAVALLGLAAPAYAEALDFILTNNTGKEITLVELSPVGAGQWQKNKVDEGEKPKSIKAGGRSTIHFDKNGTQCKWEVKATFADNSSVIFPAVNVCDDSFVVLSFKGATPISVGS